MNIEIAAKIEDYGEAIGSDIIQVLFAEGEDEDPFNLTKRYLCFPLIMNLIFVFLKQNGLTALR